MATGPPGTKGGGRAFISVQRRPLHCPSAPLPPPMTAAAASAPHHAPPATCFPAAAAPAASIRTTAVSAGAAAAPAGWAVRAAAAVVAGPCRGSSPTLQLSASAMAEAPPPPASSSGPRRSGAAVKGPGSSPSQPLMKSRQPDHNVGSNGSGSGGSGSGSTYGSTDLALMADIKACGDWRALHRLFTAASTSGGRRRINQLHAAAALTHLAQLLPSDPRSDSRSSSTRGAQPPPSPPSSSSSTSAPSLGSGERVQFGSGSEPPCLTSLVSELCRLLQMLLPRCGARQVANAAWALAKLSALLPEGRAEPRQGRLEESALLPEGQAEARRGGGREGAGWGGDPPPVRGSDGLGYPPSDLCLDPAAAAAMDGLMRGLLGRSHQLWADFNAHEASSLLYAVAQYQQHQNARLQQQGQQGRQQQGWQQQQKTQGQRQERQGQKQGQQEGLQQLGCGGLQHGAYDGAAGPPVTLPPSWLDAWLAASEHLLTEMTPQAVANCCWALAQLLPPAGGGRPSSGNDCSEGGTALSPREAPRAWLHLLCVATSEGLLEYPARSMAVLSWALAKLQFLPSQPWLSVFFSATLPLLPTMSSQDLSNVAWAATVWQGLAARAAAAAEAAAAGSAAAAAESARQGSVAEAAAAEEALPPAIQATAAGRDAASVGALQAAEEAEAVLGRPKETAASPPRLPSLYPTKEVRLAARYSPAKPSSPSPQRSNPLPSSSLREERRREQQLDSSLGSDSDDDAPSPPAQHWWSSPSGEAPGGLKAQMASVPRLMAPPMDSMQHPPNPPPLHCQEVPMNAVEDTSSRQDERHSPSSSSDSTSAGRQSLSPPSSLAVAAAGVSGAGIIPRRWQLQLLSQFEERIASSPLTRLTADVSSRQPQHQAGPRPSPSLRPTLFSSPGVIPGGATRAAPAGSASQPLPDLDPQRRSGVAALHLQPQALATLCWCIGQLRLLPAPWVPELLLQAGLRNRLRLGPRAVTELAVLLAGLPPEAQPRRLHALFWAASGSETRPVPRPPQQPLWQQQQWQRGAPGMSPLSSPATAQGGPQGGRASLTGASPSGSGIWDTPPAGGTVSGARNAVRLLWALRQTELPGSLTARKLWRAAMCGLKSVEARAGPFCPPLPASDLCRLMVAAARLGFRPPLQDLAQLMKALIPRLHELPPLGQARAVRAAVTLLISTVGRCRTAAAALRNQRRAGSDITDGIKQHGSSSLMNTPAGDRVAPSPLTSATSGGRSAVRQAVILSHKVLSSAASVLRLRRPPLVGPSSSLMEYKEEELHPLGFGGRGATSVLWAAASAASLYRRCTSESRRHRMLVALPLKAVRRGTSERHASFPTLVWNQAGRQKGVRWRKGVWQPLLRGLRRLPPWALLLPPRLPSSSSSSSSSSASAAMNHPSLRTGRPTSSTKGEAEGAAGTSIATPRSRSRSPGSSFVFQHSQEEEEEEAEEEAAAYSAVTAISYPYRGSSDSRSGNSSSPSETTPQQGGGCWVLEPWLLELQAGLAQLPPRQMAMSLWALPRLLQLQPLLLQHQRKYNQSSSSSSISLGRHTAGAGGAVPGGAVASQMGAAGSTAHSPRRLLPPGMMRGLLLRSWELLPLCSPSQQATILMGLAKLRHLQQKQQPQPSAADTGSHSPPPPPPSGFLDAAELAWELRAAASISPRSVRVRMAALRMLEQRTQG